MAGNKLTMVMLLRLREGTRRYGIEERGEVDYKVARMRRSFMSLSCAVAAVFLFMGVTSCVRSDGKGREAASSFSASSVFHMDDTLCEVVPNRLLLEGLSFHSEEYVYRHSNHSTDSTKVPQESAFYCTITGHEGGDENLTSVLIAYVPGGRMGVDNDNSFSEIEAEGHERLMLDGIEGRGYMWAHNDGISVAWLYPDDHTLQVELVYNHFSGHTYGPKSLEGMKALVREMIPAIPPIADGPTLERTEVP